MRSLTIEDGYSLEKESVNLEYKKCEDRLPRSFWETYSSFANTSGGVVALGFTECDDGRFLMTGVSDPEKVVKDLWDLIHDPNKVSCNILTEKDVEIKECGGVRYILVNVPRADRHRRPVYINGSLENGTYRRNNEGDYHCTVQEILELGRDSADEASDREILTWTVMKDVNQETLGRYRNHMRSRNASHPWLGESDEDYLCLLGAAQRCEGTIRLTRAGLLMFGNETAISRAMPKYHLDYLEYVSGEEWSDRISSDSGLWSGNVFDFYLNVSSRMFFSASHPFKLRGDVRDDDTESVKARREIVLNAIVHADYMGDCGVVVKVTPDTLTVRNPGCFRIPLERAIRGGYSDARNPQIMKMFMLAGFVERSGSGIHRVFRYCEKEGLIRPEITEETGPTSVVFTVRLSRDGQDAAGAILNMIRNDPGISLSSISEILGISKSTVVREMDVLKKEGRVVRIGGTRGYWELKRGPYDRY